MRISLLAFELSLFNPIFKKLVCIRKKTVQSNHNQNFSFLKQAETIAISPFHRTKVCACALKQFANFTCAVVFSGCKVRSFSIIQNFKDVASIVFTISLKM